MECKKEIKKVTFATGVVLTQPYLWYNIKFLDYMIIFPFYLLIDLDLTYFLILIQAL